MNSLANQPQPGRILWELACCVASSVGADGFVLHLVHPQTGMFRVFRRSFNFISEEEKSIWKENCYLLSCDTEADIDNGVFNVKTDEEIGDSDFDRESGFSPTSSLSEQHHSVASYVAKHRHTVTIQDIRRPDSRFPAGSVCLHV